MSVKQAVKRVEALEAEIGGSPPCPECGGPDDPDKDSYELRWIDPGGPEDREEWCGTCGRQTTIVITWDGLPKDSA